MQLPSYNTCNYHHIKLTSPLKARYEVALRRLSFLFSLQMNQYLVGLAKNCFLIPELPIIFFNTSIEDIETFSNRQEEKM